MRLYALQSLLHWNPALSMWSKLYFFSFTELQTERPQTFDFLRDMFSEKTQLVGGPSLAGTWKLDASSAAASLGQGLEASGGGFGQGEQPQGTGTGQCPVTALGARHLVIGCGAFFPKHLFQNSMHLSSAIQILQISQLSFMESR